MNDSDTTLLVLSRVTKAHAEMVATDADEVTSKPDDPNWDAVNAAAFDGFLRGWVAESNFWTDTDGKPHLTLRLTGRGERAIDAWRRRSALERGEDA